MEFEKIGDIMTISKGKKHEVTDNVNETSVRLLQIDDLRNDEIIKYTNDKNGVLVNENDILLAWDGANAGTIGYGKKGFIGSTIAVLRKKEPKAYYSIFLGKFLQSKFSYLRKNATGATIPHIDRKSLENLKIPRLEIQDQIRIATLLSEVETLINARRQSLDLLDDLLKSTFLKMFGKSSQDYDKWNWTSIENLAKDKKGSMRTGPFGSDLLHSEFIDSGEIRVLGIDNVVNNKFEWAERRFITSEKFNKLKRYEVFPKDVLITIMGTPGKSAVVPDNIPTCINSKHLAAITLNLDEANPVFISYSIYSDPNILKQIKLLTRGAIMGGLNLTIIKSLKLKKVPIELQNQFAEIVQEVEVLKEQYQASLRELENLYGALSQRAFRGELDLSQMDVSKELELYLADNQVVENKEPIDTVEPDFPKPTKAMLLQIAANTGIRKEIDTPFIGDPFAPSAPLKSLIFFLREENKPFTFAEFWQYANQISPEPFTYEEAKAIVMAWLAPEYPWLRQVWQADAQASTICLETVYEATPITFEELF